MMPKFAANLGVTPLQPVKSSDIIAPQTGTTNAAELNSSSSTQIDIPSAQFDWNGSGLINPLDCKYYLCYIITSFLNRNLKLIITRKVSMELRNLIEIESIIFFLNMTVTYLMYQTNTLYHLIHIVIFFMLA